MPTAKQWATAALLATSAVFVSEFTVRLLCTRSLALSSRLGAIPIQITDRRLHTRPNPRYPGHDRNGWRNPLVPEKAFLVALGDSQTYGNGVLGNEAWPRQLEGRLRRPVYSMAFGGYGPVHSLLLMDEALALKPTIIVEALYSGNDLFDCFNSVYNEGQASLLRSSNRALEERLRHLEARDPIAARIDRLLRATEPNPPSGPMAAEIYSTRRWLAEHSRLYVLLHYAKSAFVKQSFGSSLSQWEQAKTSADQAPTLFQVFDDGRIKSVLTPAYRLTALNLADPRIKEGRRIAFEAVRQMAARASAGHARFLVLMIPTKELVLWSGRRNPSTDYRILVANETRFWASAKATLSREGIEFVDALPALRGQITAGVQSYPITTNGHPNALGHQAIAEALARWERLRTNAKRNRDSL